MPDIIYTQVTLHEGIVGRPYEAGIGMTGAATAITARSVSTGALPPGLALAAAPDIRITGTPTTPGTYTFTLSYTDTAGAVVSPSYSLQVINSAGDNEKTGNLTATESAQKRRLN